MRVLNFERRGGLIPSSPLWADIGRAGRCWILRSSGTWQHGALRGSLTPLIPYPKPEPRTPKTETRNPGCRRACARARVASAEKYRAPLVFRQRIGAAERPEVRIGQELSSQTDLRIVEREF